MYFHFQRSIYVYGSFYFVSKAFFDMNHNRQGRLPKQKRSMSSKEKKDNIGTRDTVVTSKSSLEMEE